MKIILIDVELIHIYKETTFSKNVLEFTKNMDKFSYFGDNKYTK